MTWNLFQRRHGKVLLIKNKHVLYCGGVIIRLRKIVSLGQTLEEIEGLFRGAYSHHDHLRSRNNNHYKHTYSSMKWLYKGCGIFELTQNTTF